MYDHAFAPIAGIATVLLIAVLPWHLHAKNAGVALLSFWLFIAVLSSFINSIIWWDSVDVKAIAWCNISTRIIYSGNIAPVCCCLCVLRRLEAIASTKVVRTTESQRRRDLAFDLAVGLLVPIVYVALQIVNQGHRFDIVEGMGCLPTFYVTPVAIVLVMVPPLLVSLIALIYGILALRWFFIRRRQFNAILQASCSHIDRSRYLRLMAMASSEALVSFPINMTTFIKKLQYVQHVSPWISWADTHYDFDRIDQYPASIWDTVENGPALWRTLEIGRWGIVVGCFMVFLFFGTTKEARQAYARPFTYIYGHARHLRRSPRARDQPTMPMVAIETAWQIDSELDYEKKHGGLDDGLGDSKSALSTRDTVTRA